MSTKYFISPFANIRCLEGSITALGEKDLVEFEGGEALLLAAFAIPRSCEEAAQFLNNHGFDSGADSLKADVELLCSAGVLKDDSSGDYARLQAVGGGAFYSASVLHQKLGHDASLEIPFEKGKIADVRNHEGRPIPEMPYPVAHWLGGYDLSSKSAGVMARDGLGWWSETFADVKVLKGPGISAMQLSSYPKGNITVVDAFPTGGNLDLVELAPIEGEETDLAKLALQCVSDTGAIVLRTPEWQPNALAVLRASDMIEINLAGFQPFADAPRGCSVFISRKFDWKHKNPAAAPIPTGGVAASSDLSKPQRMSLAPSARKSLRPSLRVPKK